MIEGKVANIQRDAHEKGKKIERYEDDEQRIIERRERISDYRI